MQHSSTQHRVFSNKQNYPSAGRRRVQDRAGNNPGRRAADGDRLAAAGKRKKGGMFEVFRREESCY